MLEISEILGPIQALWEYFFENNCSSESPTILKPFFVDFGLDSDGSTLSWILYLPIQTHVTTFQKIKDMC